MGKSRIFKPLMEATNDVFISYALEKFRNIFRYCSYTTIHASIGLFPVA